MADETRRDEAGIPPSLVWVVLALSLLPQLFPLTGLHLLPTRTDGSLVHSLLEWSAVCTSLFTAFLGFLYLRIRADTLVLTIALAALASGLVDGLHALASVGLIPAAAELERFVPLTWAVSRSVKALILMAGATVIILKIPPYRRLGLFGLLSAGVTLLLLASAFVAIEVRESLPQSYFPGAFVKRPWDLPALILFVLNGALLFPMLVRRHPHILSRALWLSALPEVLAEAHMSFGSSGLYDHSFQLAHVLKLLACIVPFTALGLYFVRAFRAEQRLVRDLKAFETELRAKEERLNQLTDNIREVFWISAPDGSKTYYVSPAYDEIFGSNRAALYERPHAYLEAVHPDDRETLVALTREPQQVDFGAEFRILREDGECRWLRLRAFPIRDDTGNVYRLASLIEDVTEHKRAVDALQRSEARMRALLEAVPDLMFRLDRRGVILDYHARDRKNLYRRPEEFLGQRMDAVLPGFGSRFVKALAQALDTGEMQIMEYRLTIDGVEKDFEARFLKSTDDEGIALVREITEQKRLEKNVLDVSHREQQRIGHDLHDGISQQLTGIALLLKALGRRLADRAIPERDDVRQIEELVEDAVAQTRSLAHGLAPVQLDVGGLSAALEEIADGVERRYGVRCLLTAAGDARVDDQGIATHLYRIAQEAVTNAVRHGEPTEIVIDLAQNEGRVTLSVKDDGKGFEPSSSGDGMGLHIMGYRARMIDAALSVGPAPGGGTLVRCQWPGTSAGNEP